VLTVTQMLRKKGVVGKFVEFFGAGVSELSLADRAVVSNMAPEYGATAGFPSRPGDAQFSPADWGDRGTDHARRNLSQPAQNLFREGEDGKIVYSDTLEPT